MNSFRRFGTFVAPLCLFGLWAFLRFYLIMKIRRFIFQSADIGNEERVLINHGLIVLEAFFLFSLFALLRKMRRIDGFYLLRDPKASVQYGIISGLFIFAITIPVALYFGMTYSPQFATTGAIGNIFSNGAEEVIYRGILFSAALLIFRKSWFGILIVSIAFGLGHWDLPILFQAYIGIVGLVLGLTYIRTKSLAAPYLAHMIADILADSFFH